MRKFNESLSIRFKKEQVAIIREAAAARGVAVNTFVRWAVDRVLAEKSPDLMKYLAEIKSTSDATYLAVHELSRDFYTRIPQPPENVLELAEKDGAAALRKNMERITSAMAQRNGLCKK